MPTFNHYQSFREDPDEAALFLCYHIVKTEVSVRMSYPRRWLRPRPRRRVEARWRDRRAHL